VTRQTCVGRLHQPQQLLTVTFEADPRAQYMQVLSDPDGGSLPKRVREEVSYFDIHAR
jgi:hypothetical protein